MIDLPPELLALPPLALAAGVDLYLTLLFIGAAPTTGLWETPLPGALGDLDSPSVLIVVGAFYVAELVAERFPPAALVWNAFHAVIRPVSGAMLALLLLDGQPLALMIAGALVAGLLTSLAHGVRTGAAVLRWLAGRTTPSAALVSLAEDVVVIGAVSLTLDAPLWALAFALVFVLAVVPVAPWLLRAFRYVVRLALVRVFETLRRRRWRGREELPDWVVELLDDDEETLRLGGALRGSHAGVWRLKGASRFAVGWVVVRGGGPVFVFRRYGRVRGIDLAGLRANSVRDRDLFRRIDFDDDAAPSFILFGSSGPSAESLKAEFMFG